MEDLLDLNTFSSKISCQLYGSTIIDENNACFYGRSMSAEVNI